MGRIYESMKRFLADSNLSPEELPDQAAIRITFTGSNDAWICVARAREEQEQFVFYSIAPVEIQPDVRPAAAEFLHRANFGLIVGNFELDMDDGEVRFKTWVDCPDTPLTDSLMRPLVVANIAMMDRYLPAIHAVNAGAAAVAAIQLIEDDAG
jgi:hypothetical protein